MIRGRFWRRGVSCQEWVELVTAYLDGSLPPRLRRAIDRHLADCDKCNEYLAQMRRTTEVIGTVSASETPPEELLDRLTAAFEQYQRG